jgi:hypothetical protein
MLASAGWAFGVATLAALHRPVPRNPTNSGEVEHLHDLPILLGDVRQELSLRLVLADYPARLAQAPDRGQVPTMRKDAGPRREPANQGRRSSVACNELDGA